MALSPGTRLGVYDITAPLGEGGMGQVWRATDTTLGRQVAIKILPDASADDLARFERRPRRWRPQSSASPRSTGRKPQATTRLCQELVEGDDSSQRIVTARSQSMRRRSPNR
jgi:serine/threonine protein kinase